MKVYIVFQISDIADILKVYDIEAAYSIIQAVPADIQAVLADLNIDFNRRDRREVNTLESYADSDESKNQQMEAVWRKKREVRKPT